MTQRENETFKKLQFLEILNVVYDFKKTKKFVVTLHNR